METTTKTSASSQKINARMSACTCGCRGADSQHRGSYTRTVRDIHWYDGETVESFGGTRRLALVGTAQLPGEVRGKCLVGYYAYQLEGGRWSTSGSWQVLDYINRSADTETIVRAWLATR